MTDHTEQTMLAAIEILKQAPFSFSATYEYPGFILVSFDNGDGTTRHYQTGAANPTYTVDYLPTGEIGENGEGGDTGLRVDDTTVTGYSLAVQFAAVIDRIENGK